jgi:hypothetical protein
MRDRYHHLRIKKGDEHLIALILLVVFSLLDSYTYLIALLFTSIDGLQFASTYVPPSDPDLWK